MGDGDGPDLGWDITSNRFLSVWQRFMQELGSNPDLLGELTRRQAERQSELLASLANGKGKDGDGGGEGGAGSGRPDRRFAHPAWEDNPFYRYLKESYALNSEILERAAEAVGFEGEDRRALDFIIKQLVSATSPANFAATNPEVAQATVDSKGENLRRGLENYMSDLQSGKMTLADPDAFRIGENIATTKGKVIAENRLCQLIEYAPTTAKVRARPLLIVPPCINKYYILDLSEENSFIRQLLDSGIRVFLVSWANAGEQQSGATWDDYVASGVIDSVAAACEVSGQDSVNTLGYCIGGTLLACASSVMHSNGDGRVASMSLMTSFVDFCDTGDIGLFVDESFVAEQEEKYADGGLFPGSSLHQTFAYLRPDDLVWPYVVRNYMLGETPPAFDILHWNSDSTNLPGRMYAWYLRHTYLDNDIKDGTVEVCGSKVDPAAPKLPGIVVATERDHIVPWKAAYASARLLGPKVSFVLSSSGHVAGVVNPPSSGKGRHWVSPGTKAARLPADPDKWRGKATEKQGSWWPAFASWLSKRSGNKVAAPRRAGDYRHLPIEDAPGSYVSAPLPPA